MVDFKRHLKKERNVDVTDLRALFESLDRQASHIDARPAQDEAMQLVSERRDERDLILKISTGSGKTAVGLLYLLSFMEAAKKPVLYLCPTRQLVEQVASEADKLGIRTTVYAAGESHPHVDGIGAKAVILCTYDKLFNAKSTFDRHDVRLRPVAFVLDDAHAGVEEVRDAFTLRVAGGALHNSMLKILGEACRTLSPGAWLSIQEGDPGRSLELPFWLWKPLVPMVRELLLKHEDTGDIQFVLPHLEDVLRWCRCVIAGDGIEIAPDVPPVHRCQAFESAKHRLFMSATLADDSVLVRELGCEPEAARSPLIPARDRGTGERMVLAPSLIDPALDRKWVMKICGMLSKRVRVVVLSPSERKAADWERFGAKVFLGDSVSSAVAQLKNGSLHFAVFVQRYDGVDLPDAACRVLVLDGIPFGEGIADRYENSLSASSGGRRNRVIYRIEQGMGRAVRSHADYAVVILAGPELAHFIAKHDVLQAISPETREQLRLAVELAKLATEDSEKAPADAMREMVKQCLSRDDGWKQFYDENIRKLKKAEHEATDEARLAMAIAERDAFEAALANDATQATAILREAINKHVVNDNEKTGWYLQRVANYLFEVDPGDGLVVQRAAFDKNKSMICPPGIVKEVSSPAKAGHAIASEWFEQFANPNGAIAAIHDLRVRLSFSQPSAVVERAIAELAELLGAEGSMPETEYKEGPDDLWLWADLSLVIEAKNGNQKTLHKKDAGQLFVSLEWFSRTYPTRTEPVPLIAAATATADDRVDFPKGTRIITPDGVDRLLENLENLFRAAIADPLAMRSAKKFAALQRAHTLRPTDFVKKYTVRIEETP